ncbi:MAG: MerR family DNA-binding transcriptional regulator [Celeribacter marinus]|uniref:MerR family transcriptional regulator n=1 Tax=Celeribacter marinus TaxID=1397108 RepID=UPI0031805BC1
MTNEVLTIREMCDAHDVTPRTLRFYEAKELLFPIREGQKRLFTRRDRARLKLILKGKRFGFSLEEIRQLLDLYSDADNGRAQMVGTLHAYRHQLGVMQKQRDELLQIMSELEEQIDWTEREIGSME